MKFIKSPFLQAIIFAFCYGIVFYVMQIFLVKTGIFNHAVSADNLMVWDVNFYASIKENGYNTESDNTGFFILFPLIWRITHFGVWGISLLNILFFSTGYAVLMTTLGERNKTFWLLCLTLPSVYFAFLPYSEALFFFLGALSIYAIKTKKNGLIWASLFLISMVRATTAFLLPALLVMELFMHPPKEFLKGIWAFLYKYAFPSLSGLFVFVLWQYMETGICSAYFKKQAEHWGHTFSWPTLPFYNIENGDIRYHWLSALALFIDLLALCWLIVQLYRWFKGKNLKDGILIYSMGYLALVLIFILCMNPKYEDGFTRVMGANRYTLITPFCFCFLHYAYKTTFTWKTVLMIVIAANIFFSMFRAFEDLSKFVIVGFMPTVLILLFLTRSKFGQQTNLATILIIAFNFIIQLHFFQQFITPLYVD